VGRGTLEKLKAILQGELSATENVQQALNRIKELDKKIKAFIELNPNALAEAEAVDRKLKRGEQMGKLAGLTIGIKSNINVKGLRATCASHTLENYVSPYDAEVIRRVREAGGIIVGMNNMDEFACGSSGEAGLVCTLRYTFHCLSAYSGCLSGGFAAALRHTCRVLPKKQKSDIIYT